MDGMNARSDKDIRELAQSRDLGALTAIIDRYAPRLYDFAARLTRDREEAFEVTRETLYVAVRTLPGMTLSTALAPWLFGIARANVLAIIDGDQRTGLQLGSQSQPDVPLDILEAGALNSEQMAQAAGMAPIVWQAIAGMDPRQQISLHLHLREGLSVADSAEASGLSRQNGAVLLRRLERAATDAAWALLVASVGSGECAVLQALLQDPSGLANPATRRAINAHTAACNECAALRVGLPPPLEVYSALLPAAMEPQELAAMRAALIRAAQASPLPSAPVLPPPLMSGRGSLRLTSIFVGLALMASLLGGLLLVPASPIALTRTPPAPPTLPTDFSSPGGSGFVGVLVPPVGNAVPGPSPTATPTPDDPTPAGVIAPPATPTRIPHQTVKPSTDTTPTPTTSPSLSPTTAATPSPPIGATPTSGPPTGATHTPTPPAGCTPFLTSNVTSVNASAGSSSFALFNSFCRTTVFTIMVTAGSSWLRVGQSYGSLKAGAFMTVPVQADVASLHEGTTTGMIAITWAEGSINLAVTVTRVGAPPVIGPIKATCGTSDQSDTFSANVSDDYAVQSVSLQVTRPDGATDTYPMALISGNASAGIYSAAPSGGVTSFVVTATDFAGHATTANGTCPST